MSARRLSLSHLSAIETPPAELVSLAAAAGYWAVGLRMNPAAPGAIEYPLRQGSSELAETLRRMRDTGVRIYDVELIPLTPALDAGDYEPMFASAAELGAQRLNVSGDDTDFDRLADSFARICALAGRYGLGVDLEFMRWRHVANLGNAVDIVRRASAANGNVLLDALHLFRSGGSATDVAALAPGLIRSAQLSDAPAAAPATTEGIIAEARGDRRLPGQGALPLRALLAALPPDVEYSVEVPLPPAQKENPLAHLKATRAAALDLLSAVGA